MSVINTKVGKGTIIWHPELSNIYEAEIGEDCVIGAFVEIRKGVVIGDRCRLQAGVFLPELTVIEGDVFLGPYCVVCNDKYPNAEDARNKRSNLVGVIIKQGASIGARAVILSGIVIGEGAFVGAGAVVTRDVLAGATVAGNPARELTRAR